jgi:2-aminoadipate transaminase
VLPDLAEAARVALTTYRAETLQYAVRPGLPEMREFIAGYMRSDGIDVSSEQILIVNGAKHGLDLLCQLLLDEGDAIVVTAPMYFTAIPIFRNFGAEFIEIGQDDEGVSVDALRDSLQRRATAGEPPPKFIYNVPDFHNPSCVTMSRRRRESLVRLASEHRIPVIEDSPYRRIRFDGGAEPALKALDPHNVYAVGTFSKLVAPGLRVGWIAAPKEIVARLIQLKSDGGSCPLTQRIILEFCRGEGLQQHIDKVQRVYREHRDRMVAALRRELQQVGLTIPDGGYYVWLRFPEGVDTDELARRALTAGVSILPGSKFFSGTGSGAPRNYARLAFSHASPEEIDRGVSVIARLVG